MLLIVLVDGGIGGFVRACHVYRCLSVFDYADSPDKEAAVS